MTQPPTDGARPGMPAWVKVSGVVAGILVLVLVAAMFLAGGEHGPGRHAPGPRPSGQIEPVAPGDEVRAGPAPAHSGHA